MDKTLKVKLVDKTGNQPEKSILTIMDERVKKKSFKEDRSGYKAKTVNESTFTKDMSRNSLLHKRRKKPFKWSEKDTNTFYKCLEIFGTDFSMISEILNNKTQRQLLRKFHKEKKRDASRVNLALEKHESNLIHRDGQAKSFFNGVFRFTSESELSDANNSDESLEMAVAKKLRLMLDAEREEPISGEEDIKPLDYYLKEIDD